MLPLKSRFGRIYSNRKWSGGGVETRSGAGSTLAATNEIRNRIPALLDSIDARSVLDVGCGDFNWMKEVCLQAEYHGIDIVESVILENHEKYSNRDISFSCVNAVTDALPAGFDVIFCREVVFHLSFRDGRRMLQHIVSSGAKYLLATSNTNIDENRNIVSGEFRNLNLQKPPFSFPAPKQVLEDSAVSNGRILGLWKISDLVGF